MHFLPHTDPVIAKYIGAELERQRNGLELIASENYVSPAILEAVGSVLTNKYSEGYPGRRYYGGNEQVDAIETLAIGRARDLFGAEYANVQPHSGSQANMQAYFALLKLGDPILALDLAHGGHLTHGAKVSFSGKFYAGHVYGVDRATEQLDYDAIRAQAQKVRPRLIVAGASAYPRTIDFAAFRSIADEVGAFFLADIAHIAGLVVAKLHPSPVPMADVVTTTTHKTLRGPRGAVILAKSKFGQAIDKAVMPGMQGGPLDHVVAGKAVCFKEAMDPSFVEYQRRVVANARALADALQAGGVRLIAGGTDTHLVLVDVTSAGSTGKEAEATLEAVGIYVNKNLIPFDARKPLDPSGIRLGTPAITTRGLTEADMKPLGGLIAELIRQPKAAAVQKRVRAFVAEVTSRFPLYPELT